MRPLTGPMPVLLVTIAIDMLGFGLIIPLLPFYATEFGAGATLVALLFATYSLGQLVGTPILGRISDRIGRRPIMLACLSVNVIAYLGFGLADSLLTLFIARAVGGMAAGKIAVAQAYAADISSASGRAKAMGLTGAAFGFGFAFGPALGGLILGSNPDPADYGLPAFVAAGLSLLALVWGFFALPESLPKESRDTSDRFPFRQRVQIVRSRPELFGMVVIFFAVSFTFSQVEATFPLWTAAKLGWGPLQVGYAFTYIGILIIICQGFLVGRIVPHIGNFRLLVAALCSLVFALLAVAFAVDVVTLMVSVTFMCLGMAFSSPTQSAIATNIVPAARIGAFLGLCHGASSLGRVLGPAWGGPIFENMGPDWPYLIGGGIMLLTLGLTLRLRQVLRPGDGDAE